MMALITSYLTLDPWVLQPDGLIHGGDEPDALRA